MRASALGVAVVGIAALGMGGCEPEQKPVAARPPVVRSIEVASSVADGARYTGVIRARYESSLGFRVSGKIAERLVDPGDRVRQGQVLMRLDDSDFVLALKAAHAAVEAARATSIQAAADETRRRTLVRQGWVTAQVYEQNKALADASAAQLRAALAQERQAADQAGYALLRADSDGVIMDVPGEPGQVVAAGQQVVRLAHEGSREAEVYLPEGAERNAGQIAAAALYTRPNDSVPATLRELSAMADPATRTYRARYVLGGDGRTAPLGATVTIRLAGGSSGQHIYDIPVGAIFDDGHGAAVWIIDPATSTVVARAVSVGQMGEERVAITAGLKSGERIVALGAHLLKSGEKVDVLVGASRHGRTMSGFNLSAIGVRERAVTLFFIVLIALSGTFAYFQLGRAEDPTFAVKVMTVTLVWPGATADELQRQAGDRLEKRLQELTYYDRVETESRAGQIVMKLYLKDNMPPASLQEEFYQARKKVSDEAANLPRGVIGPIFNDEYSDVYFSLYALAAKDLPHRQLVLQAEDIRERLLRIAGVLKVNILGEQAQQIFVEISYQRLATLGISAQTLFDALSSQNDVTPAGFVETKGPRVYLRLDGAIDSVDVIKDIPINVGGRTLKIGDIADVRRGYVDPPSFAIRNQGERALMLGVIMKPGFNGLALGKSLESENERLKSSLSLGVTFTKVSDQAHVIAEAIDEFMTKFFTALTVVIVVSLLTLGLRVGIVVAAAIPLTLAAVFVIMMATGRDFDRITLGALIISLGLLVDDAIISIEMMVVKMEEGVDRIAAATYAWGATAAPMLSGTLVTIAGFLPVGFARSTAGEYAGNIFWVVAFSLLTSWVVAVYFIPYLGVKLLPNIKTVKGGHDGIYATKNYQRLRRTIRASVDHKWIAAGLTLSIFAIAVVGMGSVMKQFFPNSDRPELAIEVFMPPGSAFGATEAAVERVEKSLREQPEATVVTSYVGAGTPRFILSLDPQLPNPAYAQIIVLTDNAKARDALKTKMRDLVAAGQFPEARVRVTQFVFGPPVKYPVLFRVFGPDLDQVRKIADAARLIIERNPDMVDTHLDWGLLTPTLHLVLDQDRLRLLGLTPRDAGLQLQALLNGTSVTQVRENLRSVDVLVRSPDVDRHAIQDINDLTLATHDGRNVPLSQIAHLETRMEAAELKRYDRETYIAVEGDVRDGVQPPDVTAQILPTLDALKASLPEGYRIDTGGSVEEAAKANVALAAVFPLMLVATFTVLMIQVRSFSTMFMVFATAPLGLVGAVPALLLSHQAFGFNAILGLIGLSGILMRNTLILVDQIHHDMADGLSDYDAIIESTVRRARPVLLTAVAAMLAFIPLTHSTFWGALAYVLIGGVGVGTVLTLLFLPALYALWFRVKRDTRASPAIQTRMPYRDPEPAHP